ncbi:MAG: hypothetical protein WB755_11685, partial [Terriglobales bacterium]
NTIESGHLRQLARWPGEDGPKDNYLRDLPAVTPWFYVANYQPASFIPQRRVIRALVFRDNLMIDS